jgi:TetR/AcrR family transcriptional repressor of mexJK operon
MSVQDSGTDENVLVVHIPATAARPAADRNQRGPDPRTLRTRAAVAEAATTLFLRNGYLGTSVDDIAALAAVSKRSIYNNFGDKRTLFTEVVLGFTATAEHFAEHLVTGVADAADVPQALHELARKHLSTIARPQVLRLRRLIILEAARFPDLAAEYYRRAPGRVITALAQAFEKLHQRGELTAPNPARAAEHYAYLLLGATLDNVLFDPDGPLPTAEELGQIADDAVHTFLAAYRPK